MKIQSHHEFASSHKPKVFLLACLVALAVPTFVSVARADTPEKIDDPEALRQSVPRLKEQHVWTEYASPDQIKLFDGPQTVWPVVPDNEYDLKGFDKAALGSNLPPPGVHPRILFSPEDVPVIAIKLHDEPRNDHIEGVRLHRNGTENNTITCCQKLILKILGLRNLVIVTLKSS